MWRQIDRGRYGQVSYLLGAFRRHVPGPERGVACSRGKFVYDPNKGTAGGIAVEASRGAFRFVTSSQGQSSYSVQTPSGTLGIRG